MMFLNNIKNILLYYDFQPLLLFWIISDIFNNMVLWTSYDYWLELGQGGTYFLYLGYFIASILILLCINNLKNLAKCVSLYLLIYLFSTIRYIVSLYNSSDITFEMMDYKNLFITAWYFTMWVWILIKLKNENLHKKLRNE